MKHFPQPTISGGKVVTKCKHCNEPILKLGGPGSYIHKSHSDERKQARLEKAKRTTK